MLSNSESAVNRCHAMAIFLLAFLLVLNQGCGVAVKKSCVGNGTGLAKSALTGANLADNTVAFTFSNGPTEFTTDIAEYLYSNGIKATFFTLGSNVRGRQAVLEKLKGWGHLVGNMGYDQQNLTKSRIPQLQVRRTDELIREYITGDMFLFRPPLGSYDEALIDKLNNEGLRKYVGPILWDVGRSEGFTDDLTCWQSNTSVGTCAQGYLDKIKAVKSGIIDFHDTSVETGSLVKSVVQSLQTDGFSFSRIDAIPTIKEHIEANGGSPGVVGGDHACNDYQ